jgi:sec-independent protein translocase protein TatA
MDLFTPVHLVIILALALLLFGPKRLPEIGQGLGKTIREFRNAMKEGGEQADTPKPSQPSQEEQAH